jgi:DNA end-binding protein Ku
VEIEDSVYVIIRPEELAELEPPASRDIEITRFVPTAAIRSQFFLRPYYLGPDGHDAPYFALARAMREEGRAGIARWVMRKKRYVGALESDGTHLMLVTLRPAEEVVALAAPIAPQTGRRPDERELELAEQLVRSFERPFEPAAYHDEYAARLHELVEAKAHGETVKRAPAARRKEPASLADALAASLRTAAEAPRG